jgi:hypothetical protein
MLRLVVILSLPTLLAACGTSRVSETVVDRPVAKTAAVRVVYVASSPKVRVTWGVDNPLPGKGWLFQLGFYDVGDKVVMLAPPMLQKYAVKADARTLRIADFAKAGYGAALQDYKGSEALSLLALEYKSGTMTSYGGLTARLELEAQFTDASTGKVYWKGQYSTLAKRNVLVTQKFDDDEIVRGMLQQIFEDLEKAALLPKRVNP